ncbi:MAG: MBL fold metallo-hydrolase [Desulfovibrio sp.]|uniref:MBL fold metallo-hydrolase n=1 Tax=Desulfovibrio sp. 7SRBS1 TaxID=3378064 RepID=UPI003B3E0A82
MSAFPLPIQVETLHLGPLETNCHVAWRDGHAIVVDPGGEPSAVVAFLKEKNLKLDRILVTHMHFDHVLGCAELKRLTDVDIWSPKGDEVLMTMDIGSGGMMGLPRVEPFERTLIEPGTFELLGQPCHALHTPGHSQGSLSYHFPEAGRLFCGDVLFYRSIGRSDLYGGDQAVLEKSIREVIYTLPGATVVHPGHMIDTTVGDEKAHNPYVRL